MYVNEGKITEKMFNPLCVCAMQLTPMRIPPRSPAMPITISPAELGQMPRSAIRQIPFSFFLFVLAETSMDMKWNVFEMLF
jgi:hypothetical protein